ncbi:MAG: hypothetical protein FIB06_06455 [Betaproteobacteria bacterium]|nr:hypothetical protein [Betaproteobacteria bacterium]
MGHDYMLTLAGLLDGFLWYRNNGFITPPWFSPTFCGGQALFADPQSAFYSVPQFLTFLVDPLRAAYWSFLLFAGLGFWGMYLFARHCLVLGRLPAVVAATVFMFNGFYAHRMIIGHYGYQSFMLMPMVALLLLKAPLSPTLSRKGMTAAVLAGVLLAYCFHSGLTTLLVPTGLSVIALGCILAIRHGQPVHRILAARGTVATAVALGLSASKLNAGITLMSGFSRDYYPLPGIAKPLDILIFVFQALTNSSEQVFKTVTPMWTNMRWSALPHELAYGLTPIPIGICLIALVVFLARRKEDRAAYSRKSHQTLAWMILATVLLLPLSMLYYSPAWNAVLKALPLIGSTTSPFRWLIIFIPVAAILTGLAVQSLPHYQVMAAAVALFGIPLLHALENRSFYEKQQYDSRPVTSYYRDIRNGLSSPAIAELAPYQAPDNAQIAHGQSPLRCYNPLFGYRLEKLQISPLVPGPVFAITPQGTLNLRNPACMTFPDENHCSSRWDAFTTDQSVQAEAFASYRPFQFERSTRQKIADWINWLTLAITSAALLAWSLRWRRR